MLNDLRFRLRALFRRTAMEQELATELRLHFEREVARHTAAGIPATEAQRRARLAMGSLDRVTEDVRDAWGVRFIESTIADVRYALRALGRSPGFTAAVTVSLALGIGANTAIFTLMDAVLWRMLPVRDPSALLVAGVQSGADVESGFDYAQFRRMRDNATVAELAGYATAPINLSIDGSPEPSVQAHLVTGDYFSLLGVGTSVGRTIGPGDDRAPNAHPVAMLSDGYWRRRFAADPGVIGRTIRLSDTPFTIIGVTPPGFFGVEVGAAPDLFLPIMMQPAVMPAFENLLDRPTNSRPWVHAIARTRAGVTTSQAAAALDALVQDGSQPKSANAGGGRPKLVLAPATAISDLRRQFATPLSVLWAVVGVVLLIACANTANLLLARAASRGPELAMRTALGAGRRRLIRQLLVESVMLAGLAGLLGLLLAWWGTQLLVSFLSSGRTPIALDLVPNPRILAFTAGITVATGILFGLVPAWRATRVDLVPALKGVRDSAARRLRTDRMLAVVQIALSLVLLMGAGLFVRSLRQLNGEDTAGVRRQIVMMRVEPRGSDQRGAPGVSERLDRTYRDLIRKAGEIPGVTAATAAQTTPTAQASGAGALLRLSSGAEVRVPLVMIYPQYFATLGIPIVTGREFAPFDLDPDAPAVCVVNESFARVAFGSGNPLGKPCMTGRRPRLLGSPESRPEEPYLIVGVVRDSPFNNPRGETRPVVYTTFLQTNTGRGQMVLHVRAHGRIGDVIHQVRQQVAAVDAAAPVFDVYTLEDEMNHALGEQRLVAMLSGLFSGLALTLAAVGLYGLLAYTVARRKNEVGLRMALGAQPGDVGWMVTKDAFRIVALGLAIGVPAAMATARFAASQVPGLIFGLEATDPVTLAGAVSVLVAVAAVAAYLPARRASRIDPMRALRAD
jgi:predicted permease